MYIVTGGCPNQIFVFDHIRSFREIDVRMLIARQIFTSYIILQQLEI